MSPKDTRKSRSSPQSPNTIKCSENLKEDSNAIKCSEKVYSAFKIVIVAWFIFFLIAIAITCIVPTAIEDANRQEVCTCQQGGEQDATNS